MTQSAHAATTVKHEESTGLTDIEDAVPSRKRKRESTARTPIKNSPRKTEIKTEIDERITFTPAKERRVRKPARQVKNEETGEVEIHSPNDWAEVYAVVKEMRLSGPAQNAAVDTSMRSFSSQLSAKHNFICSTVPPFLYFSLSRAIPPGYELEQADHFILCSGL
jgi:hypothetical protein